jgi:hypothetical protein
MEQWNQLIRQFKDETDKPYLAEQLAHKIFTELSLLKIKQKDKFKQRMGPEYESFVASLDYPPELIQLVLGNDEFFLLTLELQQKFRR